jgi:hypothetical protein
MKWLLIVSLLISAKLVHADVSLGAVTIRNSSGSTVGSVESDGTIRNSSNSSVGKIENDGTVRNGSNSSVGKIESDGTVRNSSNSSIGKVESDGTIRNSSNSSVGKVEGYSSELRGMVAAVLFFGGSVSVLHQ